MEVCSKVKQLTEDQHKKLARLSLWAGQLMLQHGASTRLVETNVHRFSTGLGADWADISISADAIVITTVSNREFFTKVRRVVDKGINFQIVAEVQQLTSKIERGLVDIKYAEQRLRYLSDNQPKYNRWSVVLMVALSCVSFCFLFGGHWQECIVTFIATAIGMTVRQELAHRHFNPLIIFSCTAFIATVISSFGVILEWGELPLISMAACVLMLVPGVPLINAMSDALNGHINVALSRWGMASMLTLATGIGIMLGMSITGVWTWI